MIDKLRKKIFWIIQISLSIILLGAIILFTGFREKLFQKKIEITK